MSGGKAIFCTRCGVQISAPARKYCPDCRTLAKQENDRAHYRRKQEKKGKRIAPETREEKYFCYTLICQECGGEMAGVACNRQYCDECRKRRKKDARGRYAQNGKNATANHRKARHIGPRKDAGKPAETLEQWLQRHGGGLDYGKTVAREEGRIR